VYSCSEKKSGQVSTCRIGPFPCKNILTYLLNGAEPFLRSHHCAATQDLPSILWNLKVHHSVHKSPPLVPTLSQIDPVHTNPSSLRSVLILSTHLCLGLPSGLLLAFPPISYMHSSSPSFVLHALLISSSLT
jgi:hypothetical protein